MQQFTITLFHNMGVAIEAAIEPVEKTKTTYVCRYF
jgi:hypothetical protein